MRKKQVAFLLACAMSACLSFPAFAGWERNSDGSYCYRLESGEKLTDGFTEDGYYVDGSGCWKEHYTLFYTEIPARNYFLTASRNTDWDAAGSVIGTLRIVVDRGMSPIRDLKIGNDAVEYVRVADSKETVLLSFAKDMETDGYVLKLAASLRKEKGTTPSMAWYDYQVLRVLMASVSRTGDQLADAVYSSWEANNSYGLILNEWVKAGDCELRYVPGNGAGYYYIRPAEISVSR